MKKYPEKHPCCCLSVEEDGLVYSVVSIVSSLGLHYCGYVRFPARPVKQPGYGGLLRWVPVHGGITYAEEGEEGVVYGFDCTHAGDEDNPSTWDMDWLLAECKRMASGILVAAEFEDAFRANVGAERVAIIDAYHKAVAERCGAEFRLDGNMGAMIELLFGGLKDERG